MDRVSSVSHMKRLTELCHVQTGNLKRHGTMGVVLELSYVLQTRWVRMSDSHHTFDTYF